MDEKTYNDVNRKMMEEFLQKEEQQQQEINNNLASGYLNPEETNLVKWQLDINEDLERIRHLLKGDERDPHRPNVWISTKDPNLSPFNDYGVRLLMQIMNSYLNRNTILSNYDDKTIQWKVLDFGNNVADLIFNKFEEMMITFNIEEEIEKLTGIKTFKTPSGKYVLEMKYVNGQIIYQEIGDSLIKYIDDIIINHLLEKIKLYPIIVGELVDAVHSAYLRAYHGGERESLRTARHVTQTENPNLNLNYPMPSQIPVQKKQHWWNPTTWGKQ